VRNFSIFRIIGNSLPPRHSLDNNIESVRFIIQNEPRFEKCERIWILNRISSEAEKEALMALLDENGERYINLAFDHQAHFNAFLDPTGLPENSKATLAHDDYQSDPFLQEWIIRHKSQCLVGINKARNQALELGRQISTWTLVLDGGMIITRSHWVNFTDTIGEASTARFAIIPMRRLYNWDEARDLFARNGGGENMIPVENEEEPQIAFHNESVEIFDERLRYGHRNKAELLSRIGVPGPWNEWTSGPWENMIPFPSPNKGKFVFAGFVMRLPAEGMGKETINERYTNRFKGVAKRSVEIDLQFSLSRRDPRREFDSPISKLETGPLENLENFAVGLLAEKERFITEKSVPAPSGSFHDYYSVAPDWTADGVHMDGLMPNPESDDDPTSGRFDRASLGRFASRVYGLALSGQVLDRKDMLAKSGDLVRYWFLEKSTRMNPSARYAQCIPGRPSANEVGIIEFRNLALLPYALRILADHGLMSFYELAGVKLWFAQFLRNCEQTGILSGALSHDNNIGTWASVLFCSTALFVGEFGNAFYLARTASIRLGKQLGLFSIQPLECLRTRPLHYSLFNLTAWTMLVQLARHFSIQLDRFQGINGESLADAVSFCSDNRRRFSDYAADQGKYDWWIELLTKITSGVRTGEIVIIKDPNFGFPPLLML
jgi:hypothetical protein